MFPRRIRAAGSECRMCISALPALVSCRRASLPKCSFTHQKAEQRDFRHAVLSKPYKPVLCAATLRGFLFLLCKSIAKKQDAPFSRPFGATENDAQKLHALWLLPMIVVRNTAHEVLCPCAKTVEAEEAPSRN